jgi:hypothetical protein
VHAPNCPWVKLGIWSEAYRRQVKSLTSLRHDKSVVMRGMAGVHRDNMNRKELR